MLNRYITCVWGSARALPPAFFELYDFRSHSRSHFLGVRNSIISFNIYLLMKLLQIFARSISDLLQHFLRVRKIFDQIRLFVHFLFPLISFFAIFIYPCGCDLVVSLRFDESPSWGISTPGGIGRFRVCISILLYYLFDRSLEASPAAFHTSFLRFVRFILGTWGIRLIWIEIIMLLLLALKPVLPSLSVGYALRYLFGDFWRRNGSVLVLAKFLKAPWNILITAVKLILKLFVLNEQLLLQHQLLVDLNQLIDVNARQICRPCHKVSFFRQRLVQYMRSSKRVLIQV